MNNRKGLTASITSQASSSILVATTPTSQKLIESSVDEVFARYTVPQVQKLHKDYHQDISKAKDELHLLVGGKYRDLIRIAEEIDTMSSTANELDRTLADLSFKPSNYVAFGNNKFSRFDSVVRKENVQKARVASKKTILNNIINNELIGYDLRLQTDSLRRTQTLVHLAKIFYTIEKLFEGVIPSDDHGATSYTKLKRNFVSYLERKLALYTFARDSLTDADSLVNAQETKIEDGQWLEDETFDFLSEENDDEDYQYSDQDSKIDSYTNASNIPIVNYILAYIIVNHDGKETNSLQSITSRIIDLKSAHLQSVIKKTALHPQVSSTNFYKLFRFVESTAICVNDYLANDGELRTRLKLLKAWKASELIGFHHWFENDDIKFDINMNPAGAESFDASLLRYYSESRSLIGGFVSELYLTTSNDREAAASGRVILSILYNFLSGASKVQALANYEERECYISNSIFTEEFITDLISSAFKHFEGASLNHLHRLTEGEDSVLQALKSKIQAIDTETCHDSDFFSHDIISSMEEDIESYLTSVLQLGAYGSSKSDNDLPSWLLARRAILSETRKSNDNVVSKIERVLERAGTGSTIQKQASLFPQKVIQIYESIVKDLETQLDVFIGRLASLLEGEGKEDKDLALGILSHILEVKQFIHKVLTKDTKVIVGKIDKLLSELYDLVLSCAFNSRIGGNTMSESLSSVIQGTPRSRDVDVDVARKADTAVQSTLFGLVEEILDLDRFEQQKVISFFTQKDITESFSAQKNLHLLRVVDEALVSLQPSSQGQVNETSEINGNDVEKIKPSHAEQTLANILFVLSFTKNQTILATDTTLEPYLHKLNGIAELPLEPSTVEAIARAVSEQYKGNKDLFMPLLAF